MLLPTPFLDFKYCFFLATWSKSLWISRLGKNTIASKPDTIVSPPITKKVSGCVKVFFKFVMRF